jgi:hypothetical protein
LLSIASKSAIARPVADGRGVGDVGVPIDTLKDATGTTLVVNVYSWDDDPSFRAEAERIVQSFVFDDRPREG